MMLLPSLRGRQNIHRFTFPGRKLIFYCVLAVARPHSSLSLLGSHCKRRPSALPYYSTTAIKMVDSSTAEDPLQLHGLPQPLILGSASFTRKLILKEMGVSYQIVVRPIDEKLWGDRQNDEPRDLVLTLAKAKCSHLVNEIQNGNTEVDATKEWVVLTGDQVVTHDGNILEKPENLDECLDFVTRYGENPPSTVGSCVLTHIPSGIQVAGTDTATIHFKPTVATSNLVDRLVEDGAPVLSCAGGLMVEHPFVKEHIDRIDGTEDSVMGLSKDLVLRLLEELSNKLKNGN